GSLDDHVRRLDSKHGDRVALWSARRRNAAAAERCPRWPRRWARRQSVMQFGRVLPLAAVAAAAAGVMSACDAHGQIPSSVEFRVPKAPTVAVSDSGAFLGYELFVTNLTPTPMTLRRVEVLSAGKVLATLADADTSLQRATSRVTQIPLADRLKL